jgi:hypothetical protein
MVTVTVKSNRYSYRDKMHLHTVVCCHDCNDFDGCEPENRICCPRCEFFSCCEG